ncbi:hypothetical protein RHGRI_026758 [Rhododendron griersonianum]|uniref:Uncharacterized protein n=1 Tax=Rhododendron griersonianum TaxID=479676 RepID=A0AAV6IVD2_9ERIC|nr:hypothetical protein RHGRI_026758 [Rhododendron griersonianum]
MGGFAREEHERGIAPEGPARGLTVPDVLAGIFDRLPSRFSVLEEDASRDPTEALGAEGLDLAVPLEERSQGLVGDVQVGDFHADHALGGILVGQLANPVDEIVVLGDGFHNEEHQEVFPEAFYKVIDFLLLHDILGLGSRTLTAALPLPAGRGRSLCLGGGGSGGGGGDDGGGGGGGG